MNEEKRVHIIETMIRCYYLVVQNIEIDTAITSSLEEEIAKLMTQEEYDVWIMQNNFNGKYWSNI